MYLEVPRILYFLYLDILNGIVTKNLIFSADFFMDFGKIVDNKKSIS